MGFIAEFVSDTPYQTLLPFSYLPTLAVTSANAGVKLKVTHLNVPGLVRYLSR